MRTTEFSGLCHHMGITSMGRRIQTEGPARFCQRLAELRQAA